MKKANIFFILMLAFSSQAMAKDLKKLSYEAREEMTFERDGTSYVLKEKKIEVFVSIDSYTKKGIKNLYENYELKNLSAGTHIIKFEPRNTVRYMDKSTGISASVKGDIDKDILGNIIRLELDPRRMNYLHNRTVIKEANKYLNKHVRMSGILDHDIERSAFICNRKSYSGITCTQEYYYYISETGTGLDLGVIKSK